MSPIHPVQGAIYSDCPKEFAISLNKSACTQPLQTEPYLMLKPTPPDWQGAPRVGNDRYEGYCVDLAKKLAAILGFDFIIRPVRDGRYGGQSENGTWNGMIGELIREVGPPPTRMLPRVTVVKTADLTLPPSTIV